MEKKQRTMRKRRPDKQEQRREAIHAVMKQYDPTITAVEYMYRHDPLPDAQGIWHSEVWLYRVGSGRGVQKVAAAVNLETQTVVSLDPVGKHTEEEE